MAAVQGISMYKSPQHLNNISPVELPTCMYAVNSYHKHEYLKNGCDDVQEKFFSVLEKRLETVLKELISLQNEVKNLASKLGVRLPSKSCGKILDHVISANPENPPLSVFLLQYFLSQRGVKHSTSVFTHSTVASLDLSMLPSFELSSNDTNRNSTSVITIIWKKDETSNLPVLVISSNHTPLVGEFTIARYMCRTLLPDLYAKLGCDKTAEIDNWITFASEDIINGKNKERANALHCLNAHLGKSNWLVGNQMTLADIAVASAVLKMGPSKAPANVKKWLKNVHPNNDKW